MTKKILIGASFLALLAALPAFAETKADAAKTKVESTLEKAGNSIEKTTDKAGAAVKDAYTDVKAYFTDDKNIGAVSSVNVMERMTADELIGTSVQNPKGEDIGKIEDILITADGMAKTVIINDGGVLGLGGKKAAFDFNIIEGFSKDNDIVVKLSEESLKAARAFDYEATAKPGTNVMTMPKDEYSVAKIMDARVVDPSGKPVADVDTVAFEGNDADYVIVTFNKTMGMGGDKAALNIDALDLASNDGKYVFKLNSKQTAQFQSYKETTKSN